jgi:hypothetical protein
VGYNEPKIKIKLFIFTIFSGCVLIYFTIDKVDYNLESNEYCDKLTYLLFLWIVLLCWLNFVILCILNTIIFLFHILFVLKHLKIISIENEIKTFEISEIVREFIDFAELF